MSDKPIRQFETRYFGRARYKRLQYAVSRGFPKSEDGSIEGAAKAVARGYVDKVQCIDRWNHDRVKWTVKAGQPVPGVRIRPVIVIRGDDERQGRAR